MGITSLLLKSGRRPKDVNIPKGWLNQGRRKPRSARFGACLLFAFFVLRLPLQDSRDVRHSAHALPDKAGQIAQVFA